MLKISTLGELSIEELMNVKVVTASGSEQTISEAPSTIRVITAKQIEERGYRQLEDVLRDMEGVDLIHVGGYMATGTTVAIDGGLKKILEQENYNVNDP